MSDTRLLLSNLTQDTQEKLLSAEAKAILEALAAMVTTDIAPIEARHSSNRETSLMRARGWMVNLSTMSSKFVLHCASKIASKIASSDQPVTGKPKRGHREKRTGGGPWRAFCHHVSKGVRFTAKTLSDLADQYRNLSPEEKLKYEQAGKAAALSHRMGFDSFQAAESNTKRADASTLPGDVTSSGAIVATDFPNHGYQLLSYNGPDFFAERYKELQVAIQKRHRQHVDSDGLTSEESEQLQAFSQSGQSSDTVLKSWKESAYTEITSSLATLGSNMKTMQIFEYCPPVLDMAKATWTNNE